MMDPGFSWGGDSSSQSGIILQIFCRKLHENERIWTPMRVRVRGTPLDPPTRLLVQKRSVSKVLSEAIYFLLEQCITLLPAGPL